jgi:hypothetical protein
VTDSVAAALARFSKGELDLEELERALAGIVRFRYADTDERSAELLSGPLPLVTFRKEDIERVLRRHLRGELTAREASDWAATLRLLDCFELDAPAAEADAVWDVLDQLSSPDAWGALTTESAIQLIHQL